MTQLRSKDLSDQGFVLLAERVAFFVIEHALAALPTKEMTVETVYGHKYTGLAHDDSIKLCGVGVAEDGGQMLSVLTKIRRRTCPWRTCRSIVAPATCLSSLKS